jgi:hypothetical protein
MAIEWAQLIGGWIFSWPVAVVIVALSLRDHLAQWLREITQFKAGPVEITRQLQAVAEAGQSTLDSVSEMIILLGESRLTEIQVLLKTVGVVFSKEDTEKMTQQISAMEELLKKIEGARKVSIMTNQATPGALHSSS